MINYIWVNNKNSYDYLDFVIEEQIKEYNYAFKNLFVLKKQLLKMKFDKVYICLSPEWVPPYYHTLFYGLIEWLENKLNRKIKINKEGYEEE